MKSILSSQGPERANEFISADDLVWLAESEPNAALDSFGNRPIHFAAKHGSVGAIERLLTLGANANLRNSAGKLASELAREAGYIDAALMLRASERSFFVATDAGPKVPTPTVTATGSFQPTHTTNLLNSGADWSIPEEIAPTSEGAVEVARDSIDLSIIESVISELNLNSVEALASFYIKIIDIFQNIKPLIDEFNNIDKEIGEIQSQIISMMSYIRYETDVSDLVQDQFQLMDEQLSRCSDIYNIILYCISFLDGDLLINKESGDQDLLNIGLKLVPPLHEALHAMDSEGDLFVDEWRRLLKEKTFWDPRRWIVPVNL